MKAFKASLSELAQMMVYVEESSKKYALSEEKQRKVMLAVEEALVNIISYAYQGKEPGGIEIECSETGCQKGIEIKISDYGFAFNPTKNEAPVFASSVEEASIGGLGIYLFSKMMDKVCYERKENKNSLTLIKYF